MEVTYVDEGKTAVFNGRTYRLDKRTGYYLASRDTDGKRKRLHIAVWEHHNGAVPEGHHIHHLDHDKSNNEITNLQCLTVHDHLSLHAQSLTEEQLERKRKNLIDNAIPKASEWHRSEAGRKWHKEHGAKCWEGIEPLDYECTYCGAAFKSRNRYSSKSNRFCSNKCKTAYRRKMGYDDITIKCEICGEEFTANKYQKRTKCPKCAKKRKRAV